MTTRKKKKKLQAHIINKEWCKGCGICVTFCPKQVLELDEKDKAVAVRPEACIACKLCELRCPDLAVEIITTDDTALNTQSKGEEKNAT